MGDRVKPRLYKGLRDLLPRDPRAIVLHDHYELVFAAFVFSDLYGNLRQDACLLTGIQGIIHGLFYSRYE